MQHFLKAATGAAGTQILAAELLFQQLVAVDHASTSLDPGFGRETPAVAC